MVKQYIYIILILEGSLGRCPSLLLKRLNFFKRFAYCICFSLLDAFSIIFLGNEPLNVTKVGTQNTCELSELSASTTAADGTIYISTAKSDPGLFKIDTVKEDIEINGTLSLAVITDNKHLPKVYNTSQPNKLCPTCPVQVSFGNLTEVEVNWESYKNKPIDFILEDQYNIGSFFINSGFTLAKLNSDGSVEHVLGDTSQKDTDYAPGNSRSAKFSYISAVIQHNETVLLLADYLNNCVREYNSEVDWVRQLVGKCNGSPSTSHALEPGQVLSPDANFMSGLLDMVHLKKQNVLVLIDHGYRQFSKYNFDNDSVELLHPTLKRDIPQPSNMVKSQDEKFLYVVHRFALSKVNFHTFEVTKLIGEVTADETHRDILFVGGPFSKAAIGYLHNINWLVQDQLLVSTGTYSNEMLMFFDLKGEQAYSACRGKFTHSDLLTPS